MSKDYLLITAKICWADEFDCEIFALCSKDAWEENVRLTRLFFEQNQSKNREPGNHSSEVEIGFGTNESLEVVSFDEWIKQFNINHSLTEDEFKRLVDLFHLRYGMEQYREFYTFGTGDRWFTALAERAEESEEKCSTQPH